MDIQERKNRLVDIRQLAKCQPGFPWWVMDVLLILEDVVSDLDDIAIICDHLDKADVAQQKAIKGIKDQYSEVLYKLKSGD